MKGHVGRSFALDAERYLRIAVMWNMDVIFADDDNRREVKDAEWVLDYPLIDSYIQMRCKNMSRHFYNSVLLIFMSSHTAIHVIAKQIALRPSLIRKPKIAYSCYQSLSIVA